MSLTWGGANSLSGQVCCRASKKRKKTKQHNGSSLKE